MRSPLGLLSCAALLLLSLSACSSHHSASLRVPASSPLAARRLTGHETLRLASGIRIYADSMFTSLAGAVQFRGHVFVDGSQQPSPTGTVAGWPQFAYADNAWWDEARQRLTLQGHVAVETTNDLVIEGTQLKTTLTMDHGRLKIEGPTHTYSHTHLPKL